MNCRDSKLGVALAILLCGATLFAADEVPFSELDKTGADLIAKGDLAGAEVLYRGAVEQARAKGDRTWTAEFLPARPVRFTNGTTT